MDKAASILAALDAGKMPSQQQTNDFIEWFLKSPLAQIKPSSDGGDLSEQGRILVEDVRELFTAYQLLGEHKNGDNLLQQSLWHLSQADISATTTQVTDDQTKEKAQQDASALARAIRTVFGVFWTNITQESSFVFHDFASFMRLALADAADFVSRSAGATAETLRDVNEDIEQGDRNELGMKNVPEEEKFKNQDAKEQWERAADTVKVAGSKTIGAGQAVAQTTENLANKSTVRVQDAFNKICDRAQEDEEYHKSISTIFSVLQKWLHKSLDAAGDVNADTSLEAFIDDPTPDQHLIKALRGLRSALERAADESLDGVFGALRVCAVDVHQDGALRSLAEDALAYAQRSLEDREFVRSEQSQKDREGLQRRWDEISSAESEEGRKWREDVGRLKTEWSKFEQGLSTGEDLGRVKKAAGKLGKDLEEAFGTAVGAGAQKVAEQPVWMWQDLFNAHLPRLMSVLKDIPIPRTEYKDADIEFVLEDLDVSRFALLPGHAYIRNITDIDIRAPASGEAQTSIGSLTRIYAQGVQLELRDVSFWFKQKTATIAPSEFSGLLALTLPPQGVDIDVVVRAIPSSPDGLKLRAERGRFLEVQRVEVKLSSDMTVDVRETNHPILAPLLKPVIAGRVREAIQNALADRIRGALEGADALAWDVGVRADVFEDAGLARGAALLAGAWSELGNIRKQRGFGTWRATGTGVVLEGGRGGEKATFAMGAEPQVLSGEKRGPRGNFSESLEERADKAGVVPDQGELEDATVAVGERAKEVVGDVKDAVMEGVQEVKDFSHSVQQKAEAEKKTPGWESHAFDVQSSAPTTA